MDTGIHGSSTGKLKFEDYIHSSKATQLENKKYQKKVDAENHKEFIKNNRLTLKSNRRFRGKKNVFTDKVNKITLSANDDKIMQSIDVIETLHMEEMKNTQKKKKN